MRERMISADARLPSAKTAFMISRSRRVNCSGFCLGIVSAATKGLTGYMAARIAGADTRGRLRAGAAMVARGEFSIVIAGLGVALEPQLGPLSAAYVLFLAVIGPVLTRAVRR